MRNSFSCSFAINNLCASEETIAPKTSSLAENANQKLTGNDAGVPGEEVYAAADRSLPDIYGRDKDDHRQKCVPFNRAGNVKSQCA
jgi:hypothetical protein